MNALALALLQQQAITDIERLPQAKIPIIKLRHLETNYRLDICFNIDDGLITSKKVKGYIEKFPEAKYLIMFMKMFLSQRRLNETFSGGIGSFVLFNMVIAYLQHSVEYSNRGQSKYSNLGGHLMGFLQMYALDLNNRDIGISVETERFFVKKDKGWFNDAKQYLLSVEHKVNKESIDIGAASYAYDLVKKSLDNAYKVLLAWTPQHNRTPLGMILKLDSYFEDRMRQLVK